MANVITCSRIILSLALLPFEALSPVFYALYIVAGLTDMIDGPIARKTGTESEKGAKLDSIADLVFVAVCLVKLLPVMEIPVWLLVWFGIIAAVKIANIVICLGQKRGFALPHTAINRMTGLMLFILPLSLETVNLAYSGAVVCIVATIAAIHEGITIKRYT